MEKAKKAKIIANVVIGLFGIFEFGLGWYCGKKNQEMKETVKPEEEKIPERKIVFAILSSKKKEDLKEKLEDIRTYSTRIRDKAREHYREPSWKEWVQVGVHAGAALEAVDEAISDVEGL